MQTNVDGPGARRDDRSLGELFSDLSRETTTLVRQEVELAKTELSQKASRMGKDVGLLAAGGAVAYAGFLALVAAVILSLAEFDVPLWLSALLVGALVTIVGAVLGQRGWNDLKNAEFAPRETVDSIKRDRDMVKEQI